MAAMWSKEPLIGSHAFELRHGAFIGEERILDMKNDGHAHLLGLQLASMGGDFLESRVRHRVCMNAGGITKRLEGVVEGFVFFDGLLKVEMGFHESARVLAEPRSLFGIAPLEP
jgi:hypothetical protein